MWELITILSVFTLGFFALGIYAYTSYKIDEIDSKPYGIKEEL